MRNSPRQTHKPETQTSAGLFAALGDETRLKLIHRLGGGEAMSITRLASSHAVTRQAVTKHLHVLRDAGLVRCSSQGREKVWQIEHQRLEDAKQYLDLISKRWDSALSRLEQFVSG